MNKGFKIQAFVPSSGRGDSRFKILEEIIKRTREDVEERKKQIPLNVMLNSIQHLDTQEQRSRIKFGMTMKKRDGNVGIIAEIKFASPTEGNLGSADELLSRVQEYEAAGVDAISIITDPSITPFTSH